MNLVPPRIGGLGGLRLQFLNGFLTHDVATITRYAYERMAAAKPMTGVIEVTFDASIGRVIEDLLFILDCSLEGELEGQIYYLPL